MVVNSKWGTKRLCLGCGKRFYDMRRDPIVCPACDTSFKVSAPARTRRQRMPEQPSKVVAPLGASTKTEDPDVLVAANGVDIKNQLAEAIENPVELGKDDDDIAEAIEGIEETEKAVI